MSYKWGFAPNTVYGSNSIQPETSVLINGRPSEIRWTLIILSNSIESMRVLRSCRCNVWSEYNGGVVNRDTKNQQVELKRKRFAGYGSFSTVETGLNIGESHKPLNLILILRDFL